MRVKHSQGFTLIELVAIIVLMGVLAAYVAPKFSGSAGIAEYTLRDQIISTLRFVQQRAMYDHSGACYGVSINATAVTPQQNGSLITGALPVFFSGEYDGYFATATTVFFDGLGNPLIGAADCSGATNAPVAITVSSTAGANLQIAISAAGYVEKI